MEFSLNIILEPVIKCIIPFQTTVENKDDAIYLEPNEITIKIFLNLWYRHILIFEVIFCLEHVLILDYNIQ